MIERRHPLHVYNLKLNADLSCESMSCKSMNIDFLKASQQKQILLPGYHCYFWGITCDCNVKNVPIVHLLRLKVQAGFRAICKY